MNYRIGTLGERSTADFLIERKWTILYRRWRCCYGEIDIISLNPNDILVFIEVKFSYKESTLYVMERINSRKIKRIENSIEYFLQCHSEYSGSQYRIDCIGIGKGGFIRHIKNIF